MEASLTSVKGLMMFSDTTFSIPVYQRAYSWKTEDVDSILDEIDQVINHKKSIIFLGNIILYKNNKLNDYEVIDGQQRTVTLFLITLAIRDLLKNKGSVYTDWAAGLIDNFLCVNAFSNAHPKAIKLKANNKDREALESIFNNGKVVKERVNGNINNNYNHIKEWLENIFNNFDNETMFFDTVFNILSENIKVVKVVIEDDDPVKPQEVFESFNGTGVPLTILDLIRNYILMTKDNKEQPKLVNDWAKFESKLAKQFNNNIQKQDEFLYGVIKQELKEEIPYEEAYKGFKKIYKGKNKSSIISSLTKQLNK